MSLEFEINGVEYRAHKLDAKTQFHLSRKVAPIVPKLLPLFLKITAEKGSLLENNILNLIPTLEPFANALAEMPDEHASFIYDTCLGSVSRKQGKDFAKVTNNGILMFQDIGLDSVLPIVVKILWFNLGPFIQGLLFQKSAERSPEKV